MAAAIIPWHIFLVLHRNPISLHFRRQMDDPILSFAFVIFSVTFSLFCLILISLSIYKKVWKTGEQQRKGRTQNPEQFDPSLVKPSLSPVVDEVRSSPENSPTQLTRSLLLEVLPSDSTKWASLFDDKSCDEPKSISSGLDSGRKGSGEEQRGKKKKRKAKKKKMNSIGEDSNEAKGVERQKTGSGSGVRLESVCLYPFTSSSSAMQRKIKQQYDELVKCHESKKLTLAQVVQFANSLVDARNELQHKADVIQRKFIITKALLFKADRSSFDRLRQQIYKLELEQKRLEEDAFVYNWLQQQLKLSPAYKKMLEIGACMEKEKSHELSDSTDDEFSDISFEELLAQEKKDSFWQRNGKSRLCSS